LVPGSRGGAAPALEHDAVVVSFDADARRFAGLRREAPAR
jgi:hypothetical protein